MHSGSINPAQILLLFKFHFLPLLFLGKKFSICFPTITDILLFDH